MAQVFTILDAMIACGVDNVGLFMEETQAQCMADDIFDSVFTTCKDMTFKELDDYFKTYTEVTVAQGHIRLRPGTRRNIKAFVQWTPDELRLGRDPSLTAFPIGQVSDLIRRYTTPHEKFQADSKTLSEAAKPESSSEDAECDAYTYTVQIKHSII
jgi:hypothetical protein